MHSLIPYLPGKIKQIAISPLLRFAALQPDGARFGDLPDGATRMQLPAEMPRRLKPEKRRFLLPEPTRSIALTRALRKVLLVLPLLAVEFLGFRERVLLDRDIRPNFGKAGVDLQPVLEIRLRVRQDRLSGALGLADPAVDALIRVDDEHILTFIEAVNRTYLDTIRMLAFDAVVGHKIRHRGAPLSARTGHDCRQTILAPFRAIRMPAQAARTTLRSPGPFLRVLAGETLDPPPVWLMRQAGRYLPEYREFRQRAGSFLELCLTPELAAEVTLQPVRRFGFDAAILFADILLIPHALGQRLDYIEGQGPRLNALASPREVEQLCPPNVVDEALSPVFQTVTAVRARLPREIALIGFAGAPWTVAIYMIGGGDGLDAALQWVARDPDGYAGLSRVLEAATIRYLCGQVDAGADALQLFDSWAGSLRGDAFRRFSIDATRRITEGVHAVHPGIPIIGFPRGAKRSGYLDYARHSGVGAVAVDQSVCAEWASRELQPILPVQGNLDPELLSPKRDGLRAEVKRIRHAFRHGPHVFNLGHGIRPDADPGRVELLVSTLRDRNAEGPP